MLTLYYSPGACSLSPHIALREAGIPHQLDRVDLRGRKLESGGAYTDINPKGYVPALRLEDGYLLTEGAVMVQYIADLKPETKLAPPNGTFARVRLQEWLHYIATELHKGLSPLFSPVASEEYKQASKERFAARLAYLGKELGDRKYLLGDDFTVADGYVFWCMRTWKAMGKGELTGNLLSYFERIGERPAVQAALEAEGFSRK